MNRFLTAITSLMLLLFFAMSCQKPDEPNPGGDDDGNVLNGHEYVDLGLPSGTLWATCNIGADTPEGFGNYYAWGETVPKDLYDWKSYKYGNYERNGLTKYCTDSILGLDGFIDSLTILEPVDDVAMVAWGKGWRMPTKEEWEELYRETTCTWTTQNGVAGRLLTGSNGNSIFLPATGFRLDGELIGPSLGIYWSSSLHTGFPERGWSFHYDLDECQCAAPTNAVADMLCGLCALVSKANRTSKAESCFHSLLRFRRWPNSYWECP